MRCATLLVVLSMVLAACGGGSSEEHAEGGLSELRSVDELRAEFNEDRGEARLLLLLSPT